jgi:hypothetical protein
MCNSETTASRVRTDIATGPRFHDGPSGGCPFCLACLAPPEFNRRDARKFLKTARTPIDSSLPAPWFAFDRS